MKLIYLILSLTMFFYADHALCGPLNKPYFFEARKDGKSIFIFGTNHVGISIDEVPQVVIEALKRQKVFMAETLKETESSGSGPQESKNTPKPFNAFTTQQLKDRGLDDKWISILQKLPGLACSVYENYEGIRDRQILDEQFEDLATKEGKTKLALDDESAMAALNKKNQSECKIEEQVKEVSGKKARQDYFEGLKEYRRGSMNDAQVDSGEDTHEVGTRNALWIKKIIAQHPSLPFVVVGYGHLGGKSGILQLLRVNGFKTWRLGPRNERTLFDI